MRRERISCFHDFYFFTQVDPCLRRERIRALDVLLDWIPGCPLLAQGEDFCALVLDNLRIKVDPCLRRERIFFLPSDKSLAQG